MAIPRISPYPMPSASELPLNRVNWQVQPHRAALLIHDMQHYFLSFFDPESSPAKELFDNIEQLRAHCTTLGIPIIYTAQPAEQTAQERGLLNDFWGPGLTAQPDKQSIFERLQPAAGNHLLTKYRYSAFHRTELRSLLQNQGRDQLIICGIYAHIGCLLTASESFMNDIQPFLVADAVADFSLQNHQIALNYAAQCCAFTLTCAQLIEDLQRHQSLNLRSLDGRISSLSIAELRSQLANLLQCSPQEIGSEDNLLDWGLDSIRLMSLVERWRQAGIEVSFTDLAERPTLANWSQLLARQAAERGQYAHR
jgi:bifunctional isochorismate lyase/aryl carrier protein